MKLGIFGLFQGSAKGSAKGWTAGLSLAYMPGLAPFWGRDAGWSSPVARQAHNLKVTGSNPVPATIEKPGQGLAGFFDSRRQPENHDIPAI